MSMCMVSIIALVWLEPTAVGATGLLDVIS